MKVRFAASDLNDESIVEAAIDAFEVFAFKCKIYMCGDANNDGAVNIADGVFLINYVFKSGAGPDPAEAGDVNTDGEANVADVVYLINFVFNGGPNPICP